MEEMLVIITISDLKSKYKNYKDIYGKIKRDVDNNIIFLLLKVYMKLMKM